MTKTALVCGAGGFIGHHLVNRLVEEGYSKVVGVDLKYPEFELTKCSTFIRGDLRNPEIVKLAFNQFDSCSEIEIYQLGADMGGAEHVFTGLHDFDIMHNSSLINLNILEECIKNKNKVSRVFYSSSACAYPEHNQMNPEDPNCEESSVYPANPDSEYGWEKLFSERMYLAAARNYGLEVRIARFHNIFGPLGTWQGGREKAPAALCRKVAQAENNTEIEIFGDGLQTRSFLYITELVEGIRKLMNSDFTGPVNIGSTEMVTINELAEMIIHISGKEVTLKHIPGPLGVRGRNSHNLLIKEKLGWEPDYSLQTGIETTYSWILKQSKN